MLLHLDIVFYKLALMSYLVIFWKGIEWALET